MKLINKILASLLLYLYMGGTSAIVTGEMIMIRSSHSFPEAMASLQESIRKQGYTVSRVQHVDVGLTASGYKTDKYRVVFFGKKDELHHLMNKHPGLIPYLPLKVAIFAEGDETIMVTANPMAFADLYPHAELTALFTQWKKDVSNIMKRVQFSD